MRHLAEPCQTLEGFCSFQKEEASVLNQLLKKDYINSSDIEQLNKLLYERRKYQAIFHNSSFNKSHKELIKKILEQENENKNLFLLLKQKIKENLRKLTYKYKVLEGYARSS